MDKCPFHKLKEGLEELPRRLRKLPIDKRGYPVPFFVAWVNGEPEFRAMDSVKWAHCVKFNRCWTCGDKLGKYKTFVVGPMCALNLTTAEPPSHLDCARWSARNCPFLSVSKMQRREDEYTTSLEKNVAGHMIKRNPGVALLYTTTSYKIFRDEKGRPLIEMGLVEKYEWWAEGKLAKREQVEESIRTGVPLLRELAELDGPDAIADLELRQTKLMEIVSQLQ